MNFCKCPFPQAGSITISVLIPQETQPPRLTDRAIDTSRKPGLQARGRHYCLRLAHSLISSPQRNGIYIERRGSQECPHDLVISHHHAVKGA